MSISLHHEQDNVFRVEAQGTLRKSDLERYRAWLASEIERLGTIRVLWIFKDFEGWDPGDRYDLSFYIKYGVAVERIAIVGEERWRELALMFASADLRKAPVEYFLDTDLADARAWLYQ